MKKVLVLGILAAIALALVPGISQAQAEAKLEATWKDAKVTVSRPSDKREEGKVATFSCRLVAVYQKSGRSVFDDRKDAEIDVNASKLFNFNFRDSTAGSGKYYIIAIIRNKESESGVEIFKVAEVISP